MWYAVQVMTGREETVKDMCKRHIDKKQYNDIFVIRFDKAKRYYGTWHKEKEIMFPGYIFIDSNNPQQIYEHLKNVPELTKMLGRDKMNSHRLKQVRKLCLKQWLMIIMKFHFR